MSPLAIFQEMMVQPQSLGEVQLSVQSLPGPASYLGGVGNGQPIGATLMGMLQLRFVVAEDLDSTETYFVRIIQASRGATKLFRSRWYVNATGAEVTNATNLSASFVRYLAIGN